MTVTVKVNEADRAAARELCDLWIPTSKEEQVAEIIAKHRMLLEVADAVQRPTVKRKTNEALR
jgi:hypothetical protein